MLEEKATEVLMKIGMLCDYYGFYYITQIMGLYDENEEWINAKTMAVYHEIAKRNGKSDYSVERSIRHAITMVRTKGRERELVKRYIGYSTTNGSALKRLYYAIRLDLEEEESKMRVRASAMPAKDGEVTQKLDEIREKLDKVYNYVRELYKAKQGKGGVLW